MKNLLIYDLKRDMSSGIGLFYGTSLLLVLISNEIFADSGNMRVRGFIGFCFLSLCFLLFLSKISHLTQDFVTRPAHMMLAPRSVKEIIQSHSIVIFLYSVILGLLFAIIVGRFDHDTLFESLSQVSIFKMTLMILFINLFVLTVSLSHVIIRKYITNIMLSLNGFFLFFVVLLIATFQVFEHHMNFVMVNSHWVLLSFIILPFILVKLATISIEHSLKY